MIIKVLVCPLNWGLGHASRIIPIIYELIQCKFDVYIGADGYALELLKQEFPALKFIKFPSYTITYGKRKSLAVKIIIQLPKIIFRILKEHLELTRIISSYSIDLVISDNRYGLWNKKINTIFITHQIVIKLPKLLRFLEIGIYKLNKQIISKYNQCWIPDYNDPDNNLTGELSHKYKIPVNTKFIGPLSRFAKYKKIKSVFENYKYDLIVILSGPEPQRTIFEEHITDKIQKSNYKAYIVQGKPGKNPEAKISKNITAVSHLSTKELFNMINDSKYIICRSGYSTIMDLIVLQRTAILIPTPGQTEQEYLARHMSKYFHHINQDKIDLEKSINELQKFQPLFYNRKNKELIEYIRQLDLLEKQTKDHNRKKT